MDTPSEPLHGQMRPPLAALGSVAVDGARVRASDLSPLLQCGERSYSAEIGACQVDEQTRLIEQVIGFALDTLGARHLDVRVRCADTSSLDTRPVRGTLATSQVTRSYPTIRMRLERAKFRNDYRKRGTGIVSR